MSNHLEDVAMTGKTYEVGYTTGVFDLFHIGHLNVIKKAKSLSQKLIVGVSTDELVLEYKFHKPIIPFEERMEIVKNIIGVDEVVAQYSHDKLKAWDNLKFNALFHGDDWKDSGLYRELTINLNAKGVDLVYFPYTKNTSSSILKSALYQLNNTLS